MIIYNMLLELFQVNPNINENQVFVELDGETLSIYEVELDEDGDIIFKVRR